VLVEDLRDAASRRSSQHSRESKPKDRRRLASYGKARDLLLSITPSDSEVESALGSAYYKLAGASVSLREFPAGHPERHAGGRNLQQGTRSGVRQRQGDARSRSDEWAGMVCPSTGRRRSTFIKSSSRKAAASRTCRAITIRRSMPAWLLKSESGNAQTI